MDGHSVEQMTNLESRVERVERDVKDLQQKFNDAIIGTMERPGLSHVARTTEAAVNNLKASVDKHNAYLLWFHGAGAALLAISGIIWAVIKYLK